MKKIIHLSDLHLGYQNMTARFTLLVTLLIREVAKPEHYFIVITGDIVEDAADNTGLAAALELLGQLKNAGFTLLCCPGNRDYSGRTLTDKQYVARFGQLFVDAQQHLNQYHQCQYPLKHAYTEQPDAAEPYTAEPYTANHSGKTTVFIGLESMDAELPWDSQSSSQGRIGGLQLQRLTALLAERSVIEADYLVVYLHHFPGQTKTAYQLADAEQLGQVLQASQKPVDLLLFGHIHQAEVLSGLWDIKRVYAAGSSTYKHQMIGQIRRIDWQFTDTSNDEWPEFNQHYREQLVIAGLFDPRADTN